ncbi:MAG: ribbon-helix-helix protein, CopG family [Dehalococcoidia bacterium]|nr:MAG: ribbon-helix-helix protein, CopG family [Dehalococcoidia bacterium]
MIIEVNRQSMRKQTVVIYISSKLLENIDNEAKQQNRSRSNIIETKLQQCTGH